MTMREYRKSLGLKQPEFAELLAKEIGVKYSAPDISRMETGKMLPPGNVTAYIASKTREKPLAIDSDAPNNAKWVIMPHDGKKCVKSAISQNAYDVLEELKYYTKSRPFNSYDYASSVGCREVTVRSCIRELRLNGIRICSDPSRVGYWLEDNGEQGDYDRTRQQMLSRAYRIFEVVKAMDEAKDGQYEWGEELG